MTLLSTLTHSLHSLGILNLAPYHLLLYSTLLGTEIYQTFIMTKISYQALPITAFRTLQKRVFPVYFRMQFGLLVLVAVTTPPRGPVSLVGASKWWNWCIFAAAVGTAGLNLLVYGPATQTAMIEKVHQETRETREEKGDHEKSPEMIAVARKFSKNHAMSIHLNLITVGATILYGWTLASRLNF